MYRISTTTAKHASCRVGGSNLLGVSSLGRSWKLQKMTTDAPSESKAHHRDGYFVNPWPSFDANFSPATIFKGIYKHSHRWSPPIPTTDDPALPAHVHPEFLPHGTDDGKMRVTWMGHACLLLQVEGLTILFDPALSDRCSKYQWAGPKRFTPPALDMHDLPPIDIVCISHNHYDHLDENTILHLADKSMYLCPLGNKQWFHDLGIGTAIDMDWWDAQVVARPGKRKVTITCTPAQHRSGRGLLDQTKSLWCGFAVHTSPSEEADTSSEQVQGSDRSFYFAGDTGYCTVPEHLNNINIHNPEEYSGPPIPMCPAFKEIGTRLGPFDLAAIPIGAYAPRCVFSPVHTSPEDAICIHEDIRSKASFGIHWGTFSLTYEDPHEPPVLLKKEAARKGLKEGEFTTIAIGETVIIG